jgi:hypothetical protein
LRKIPVVVLQYSKMEGEEKISNKRMDYCLYLFLKAFSHAWPKKVLHADIPVHSRIKSRHV